LSEWQGEVRLTWEGKDNVEACGPDEGRKPAFPSIQQHQHQPCIHIIVTVIITIITTTMIIIMMMS